MRIAVLLALLLTAAALLAGCDSADTTPSGPVASEGHPLLAVVEDGGLFLLDLATDSWLDAPFGLGTAPNDVIPDGDRLYVLNSTSNDLHVFRFDGDAVVFERRVDLGLEANRGPYAAAATGEGHLLISNLNDNSVSLLNTTTWALDTVWTAGLAPEGVLARDGRAWVINSGYNFSDFTFNPGSIYEYDLASGERLDTLALGIDPQFGLTAPDGRLIVSCTGDYGDNTGDIRVLDNDPLREVERIPVDGYPWKMALMDDGRLYVAAGGWSSDSEEHGLVYEMNTLGFQAAPSRLSTGLGAIDVAAAGDSALFVACRDAQRIDRFREGVLVRSYPLEDRPVAIALWTPAGP